MSGHIKNSNIEYFLEYLHRRGRKSDMLGNRALLAGSHGYLASNPDK